MYVKFALVALLALSGIAGTGQEDHGRAVAPDRVVGQVGVDTAESVAAPTDDVATEELDIVVPSVGGDSAVPTPAEAPDTVVADRAVDGRAGRVESDVVPAEGYQTLGVTWPETAAVGDLGGQVRTRTDGEWSGWVDLEASDNAPDAGTADDKRVVRGGSDPLWIGDADAVQLSFAASSKASPAGLSLALIGTDAPTVSDGVAGASATGEAVVRNAVYTGGAAAGVVPAVAGAPTIITRGTWGAPAQICAPDVAGKLVGAALHHTAGPNGYTTVSQAMQQIRNDAIYHINTRGWCDIGYNFIVDKWGNIYEGRAHSLTQAVIGVHAGGFNTGTVGVSLLGTYDARPSAAAQAAAARIIGWRLGAYGIDPRGSMTYYTGAGENSRFKNQNVALPRVFGHRDVAFTACPGNGGYAALGNIRSLAAQASYTLRSTLAQPVVKALYADLLGRNADAWGLTSWSGMLASGAGQPSLVAALTKSEEYVRLRVTQAYTEVLGRKPDAGGLAGWTRTIRGGHLAVDDVQRLFYDSAEYYQRAGGTPRGYVSRLFRTAFDRAPSANESTYWATRFRVAGRGVVVHDIWFSSEAAKFRAGNYYQLFLKRNPDVAGQDFWAHVLLKKGEGAVRIGIAGSTEYRVLAAKRFP